MPLHPNAVLTRAISAKYTTVKKVSNPFRICALVSNARVEDPSLAARMTMFAM